MVAAGVITGQQGDHVPIRLNLDLFHLVGFYGFGFYNPVAERFPHVGYLDFVTLFERNDVVKILAAMPPPVSGNYAVGIDAAYRQAGL